LRKGGGKEREWGRRISERGRKKVRLTAQIYESWREGKGQERGRRKEGGGEVAGNPQQPKSQLPQLRKQSKKREGKFKKKSSIVEGGRGGKKEKLPQALLSSSVSARGASAQKKGRVEKRNPKGREKGKKKKRRVAPCLLTGGGKKKGGSQEKEKIIVSITSATLSCAFPTEGGSPGSEGKRGGKGKGSAASYLINFLLEERGEGAERKIKRGRGARFHILLLYVWVGNERGGGTFIEKEVRTKRRERKVSSLNCVFPLLSLAMNGGRERKEKKSRGKRKRGEGVSCSVLSLNAAVIEARRKRRKEKALKKTPAREEKGGKKVTGWFSTASIVASGPPPARIQQIADAEKEKKED